MSNTNSGSSSGIGFFGLLTIVFVTLKLTDYIDWSWFWVLIIPITGLSICLISIIIAVFLAMRN